MDKEVKVVKNLPASTRDMRSGFDPWVGKISWKRKYQPTPVFLPGESYGQRSLASYSPWGLKELGTTEATSLQLHTEMGGSGDSKIAQHRGCISVLVSDNLTLELICYLLVSYWTEPLCWLCKLYTAQVLPTSRFSQWLPGDSQNCFYLEVRKPFSHCHKAFCVLRMLVNISETQFLNLKHVHNAIYLMGLWPLQRMYVERLPQYSHLIRGC